MNGAKLGWRILTILVVIVLFYLLMLVEGCRSRGKQDRMRQAIQRELEASPLPSPDRVADLERRLAAVEEDLRRLHERAAPTPDEARGDALLAKFPNTEWSATRRNDILRREIVDGVFRSKEEAEFLEGFDLWNAALERRTRLELETGKPPAPPK